ncbi:murein hydrolase activator EnvC family protein [Nocardiopsis composta]|uniref:Murein DD-endopeptidase MepM/ murein hydrolase activator NlpD n=1 Tax=Nocardiopsis composta TaxID=157465 RepID=A0A7W8VGC0_9ACTN|nr:M23 family metallopeptidase [Nocardiopsis composta]MBB5434993.1 murein DD-endopeptidase MepM/ murein hydrolase activator NlpD [Nocardiopsis composta]
MRPTRLAGPCRPLRLRRLLRPVPAAALPLLAAVLLLACCRPHPAAADGQRWHWPLAGRPGVVRPFAPPPEPWLPGHRGVDLAAPAGAEVRAAGAGRVAFAGRIAGVGAVSVQHGALRTTYLPVVPSVARGDPVAAGDPLGTLDPGARHCPGRPCLHWGLRLGRDYLDPLGLLGLGAIRLLPPAGHSPAQLRAPPGREPGGRPSADAVPAGPPPLLSAPPDGSETAGYPAGRPGSSTAGRLGPPLSPTPP